MKARGAVKFLICIAIALFGVVAVFCGDHSGTLRPFMYTVACGVLICIAWPTQEEGDALLQREDGSD